MAFDKKALIVEDESVLYRELETWLKEIGYIVLSQSDNRIVDNYDSAVQLIKRNTPTIAILDIEINGDKNGLELADYIKERFKTFIIILTGCNTAYNRSYAKKIPESKYLLKAEKLSFTKEVLLSTLETSESKIQELQEGEAPGDFFWVKEVKKFIHHKPIYKEEITFGDAEEIFIKWKEVIYIESYNSKKTGPGFNNRILIHSEINNKIYMMLSSLTNIESQLPDYFVRYSGSHIINLPKASFERFYRICKINDLTFKVSDKYRTRVIEKIQLLLTRKK